MVGFARSSTNCCWICECAVVRLWWIVARAGVRGITGKTNIPKIVFSYNRECVCDGRVTAKARYYFDAIVLVCSA